jgi:hypothetical protein
MRSLRLCSPSTRIAAALAVAAILSVGPLAAGAQPAPAQPTTAPRPAPRWNPPTAPFPVAISRTVRAAAALRRPGSPTRLSVSRAAGPGGGPQNGGPAGGPAGLPGGGTTGAPGGDGGGGGGAPLPYYQPECGTDLGDLVAGEGVDLAARDFDWRTPGPAFALLSFSTREACVFDGPWPADGSVPEEVERRLAADTALRHRETGSTVFVSQQVDDGIAANVLYPWSATFRTGGYAFWLYSYGNVYVAGETGGGTDQATNPWEASEAVILEAVADLAPELDLACFYRRVMGSWSDLAALGVGDPRPAIPEGFTEASFHLERLISPPETCAAPAYAERDFFSVTFQRGSAGHGAPTGGSGAGGDGTSDTGEDGEPGEDPEQDPGESWGWIAASASTRLPEDPAWPMYLDGFSLAWTTEHHYFWVYGYDGTGPFEQDVLFAIARALDPTFEPPML